MSVLVKSSESDCQLIVNFIFWRINDSVVRNYRAIKRILENRAKFSDRNNMKSLQDIFYHEMLCSKVLIHNEVENMLGKPNEQPTLHTFRLKLNEVWDKIANLLVEKIKMAGEENLFQNSNLKNYIYSFNRHVVSISSEEQVGFDMFTDKFDSEIYINQAERR